MGIDKSRVKLQIWDTAGQERFRSIAPIYYRGADAAILVFDVRTPSSLQSVKAWISELKSASGVSSNIILVIAANKVDLDSEVEPSNCKEYPLLQEAMKIAETQGASIHCTSAKTKIGLTKMFMNVSKDLLRNYKENNQEVPQKKTLDMPTINK